MSPDDPIRSEVRNSISIQQVFLNHMYRITISHPEPARWRPAWLVPILTGRTHAVPKVILIQQVPHAPPAFLAWSGLPFAGSDLAAF
jgi:hypothetical protein